ncbi:MAG: hypothetical protein QNJ37_22375 [Crocosphaera sp.]|nr:hypothetical protein [Crocosphaera sp.]
MEPISLIMMALVAGATAAAKDTAGKAVKDAYEALKTLIKRKFDGDSLAQAMVDAKPEEIQQAEGLLKGKISDADVDKDEEIIKVAQELLKQAKPDESATGKFNVEFKGEVKGAQIGDRNVQQNKFG